MAENGCATTEIVGAGHKGAEIMIYSKIEDTVADEADVLNLKEFGEGPESMMRSVSFELQNSLESRG
ncbi:hypothetical protein C1J03_10080 [Sulfitobacter sp. SK012]|nr:hypothetical protein C1J03_10080 [Sulfitobacter sp. SK012]